MRRRSGTEPVTARSALRLRLLLSSLFVPLFLAGAALFGYWAAQSGAGDVPSRNSLCVLALICLVLTVFAALDLAVLLVRRRRARGRGEGS